MTIKMKHNTAMAMESNRLEKAIQNYQRDASKLYI